MTSSTAAVGSAAPDSGAAIHIAIRSTPPRIGDELNGARGEDGGVWPGVVRPLLEWDAGPRAD